MKDELFKFDALVTLYFILFNFVLASLFACFFFNRTLLIWFYRKMPCITRIYAFK